MEVILREDIPNLGKIGDVVRVRDGFARNYLLPRGLVLLANKKNIKTFERTRRGFRRPQSVCPRALVLLAINWLVSRSPFPCGRVKKGSFLVRSPIFI